MLIPDDRRMNNYPYVTGNLLCLCMANSIDIEITTEKMSLLHLPKIFGQFEYHLFCNNGDLQIL